MTATALELHIVMNRGALEHREKRPLHTDSDPHSPTTWHLMGRKQPPRSRLCLDPLCLGSRCVLRDLCGSL
jgi:hypothetical protein